MNGERCMLRDSNLYPRIISATPDLNIILSKLFDIARRWSTTVNQDGGHPKPQIRIERTGRTCMPDSNGYSIICDHAGHTSVTLPILTDVVVTRIQDGGHHFRFLTYGCLEFW